MCRETGFFLFSYVHTHTHTQTLQESFYCNTTQAHNCHSKMRFGNRNEKHIHKNLKLQWLGDLQRLRRSACRECGEASYDEKTGTLRITAVMNCYDDALQKYCTLCAEKYLSKFTPHQCYHISVTDFNSHALEPDPRDNLVDRNHSTGRLVFLPCADCGCKLYDVNHQFNCAIRTDRGSVLCERCRNMCDTNIIAVQFNV